MCSMCVNSASWIGATGMECDHKKDSILIWTDVSTAVPKENVGTQEVLPFGGLLMEDQRMMFD